LKKKDINPLFLKYESITFEINDFTKPNKVLMYAASGKKVLENGVQMYEVDYEPLFEENEYLKLLKHFDESPLLIHLFKLMSFNYFTLYSQCICWYSGISKVNGAFNYKELMEKYESKKVDDYACPILKYLELDLIDNINFYKNINTIMRLATLKNIKSIDVLLYGIKNPKITELFTPQGKLLINSVQNIVYNRFLNFLEIQKNKKKIESAVSNVKLKPELTSKEMPSQKTVLFDNLFINPKLIEECLELLRDNEKPSIDNDNKYIGKCKGVLVIWFNVLERKSMFNISFSNDIKRANCLNTNFKNLNISEALFRSGNTKAKKNYQKLFETEIASIKH